MTDENEIGIPEELIESRTFGFDADAAPAEPTGLAAAIDSQLNPLSPESLDFMGEPGEAPELQFNEEVAPGSTKAKRQSKTVLRLDRWSLRKGREALEDSPALQECHGIGEEKDPKARRDRVRDARRTVADFHALSFEPNPEMATNPAPQRLAKYIKAVQDTPEYATMRQESVLDEECTAFAVRHLSESWAKLQQTTETGDEFRDSLRDMSAAREALKNAAGDVKDYRNAQRTLGGMGGDASRLGTKEVSKLFKRIQRSEMLREIIRRAGKYRMSAGGLQRSKVVNGVDEVVGVEITGNVERFLPHELAFLIDDGVLGSDAERRFLEGNMMSRKLQSIKRVGQGPLVVVVDESSSMTDEPIWNAKSIALAIYWIARQQQRWCCLVGFSHGRGGTYCTLPPREAREVELLDWLDHFAGGGTSADVPLVEVPENWESLGCPRGKTSMVLITDAYIEVTPEQEAGFIAWKQRESCKLTTIVLSEEGCGLGYRQSAGYADSLNGVSDRVPHVTNLSVGSDAVNDVLSI